MIALTFILASQLQYFTPFYST